MASKVEKLKNSKVKLLITVPAAEMVKYYKQAFEALAPMVKIAGFRPGKAPRKMIESGVGIMKITSQALDDAIQASYIKALNDEKLMPIIAPKVVITKYPEYGLELEEVKNDLEYEAETEVFPDVVLDDYSSMKIDDKSMEKVKEEDVNKILGHLQKQRATFKEVDRTAKKGDFAEITYEGYDRKVKKDQLSSKNHPIVLGEGSLIPGFEDHIVGMKKGEEKTFKIKFPKDYHAKDYAGQEVEFRVKVENLKEIELPELNDEFAKNFDRKDLADLKKGIEESLGHEMETKHQHELEEKVLDKVLPLLKVEIPETLIERETDNIIEGFKKQLKSQGLDFESYLKSTKKDEVGLRKELSTQAEKNVRIGFLLGKIIQDQKMDEKDPESGRKALTYLVKKLTKKK